VSIVNNFIMKKKPYWGDHFWARGYFVSTVGIDEEVIKRYVKYQEKQEREIISTVNKIVTSYLSLYVICLIRFICYQS